MVIVYGTCPKCGGQNVADMNIDTEKLLIESGKCADCGYCQQVDPLSKGGS